MHGNDPFSFCFFFFFFFFLSVSQKGEYAAVMMYSDFESGSDRTCFLAGQPGYFPVFAAMTGQIPLFV